MTPGRLEATSALISIDYGQLNAELLIINNIINAEPLINGSDDVDHGLADGLEAVPGPNRPGDTSGWVPQLLITVLQHW